MAGVQGLNVSNVPTQEGFGPSMLISLLFGGGLGYSRNCLSLVRVQGAGVYVGFGGLGLLRSYGVGVQGSGSRAYKPGGNWEMEAACTIGQAKLNRPHPASP